MPETTYTHLYIRQPDEKHQEVGDVDFVLGKKEFQELKDSLLGGAEIKGIEVLNRSDINLISVFDPDIDALSFIGAKDMAENIQTQKKLN